MALFTDGPRVLEAAELPRFAALVGRLEPLADGLGEELGEHASLVAAELDDEDVRTEMHHRIAALGLLGSGMLEDWLGRHGLALGHLAHVASTTLAIRGALARLLATPGGATVLGEGLWRTAALRGEAGALGWLWGTSRRPPLRLPASDAITAATGWLMRQHGTASRQEIDARLQIFGVAAEELDQLAVALAPLFARPPVGGARPMLPGVVSTPKADGEAVRSLTPDATWARLAPILEEFGITRVADVTGLDIVGIPVWSAVRPASRWQITVHAGKGLTAAAARVGACAEAIECACAEEPPANAVRASLDGLAVSGRAALDPRELELPSRSRWAPGLEMPWVDAIDLVSGASMLVPAERAFRVPAATGLDFTSNGQASGNTRDEAIAHALCELIERDVTATLRFQWLEAPGRLPPPLLDLDGLPVSAQTVLAKFSAARLTVQVLDLTSDLGVPVFLAVVGPPELDPDGPDGQTATLSAGSGAHPDAEVALVRALTEAAQTRAVVVQGAREDLDTRELDRTAPRSHKLNELGLHSRDGRLALRANPRSRRFADVPSRPSRFVDEDVAHLVSALVHAGLDRVLIVDLARGRGPLAVVRAIVPGLQDLQGESITLRARRVLVA